MHQRAFVGWKGRPHLLAFAHKYQILEKSLFLIFETNSSPSEGNKKCTHESIFSATDRSKQEAGVQAGNCIYSSVVVDAVHADLSV